MNIAFPFLFDHRGRTAESGGDAHIREMLEELLFTSPGERVNRPDFGSGVRQLVFAPNSAELASAVQFTMRATVQRWLGDLVDLRDLMVDADDATLTVTLSYLVRRTNEEQTATFTRTL